MTYDKLFQRVLQNSNRNDPIIKGIYVMRLSLSRTWLRISLADRLYLAGCSFFHKTVNGLLPPYSVIYKSL